MTPVAEEETGSKDRHVIREDGQESELTYSRLSPRLVIADHTSVPDALAGRGIGGRLVARLVADAEARGFRIVPLCPFVNAWRRDHLETAAHFDVLPGAVQPGTVNAQPSDAITGGVAQRARAARQAASTFGT